jgi:hypothetical protein
MPGKLQQVIHRTPPICPNLPLGNILDNLTFADNFAFYE